jgi:UDP-N-acetylglucosamine 2-epimerase (non-hydrolysing)
MMRKSVLLIAGTRPNFIKLSPLYHRLSNEGAFEIFICHTGQHFDFNMSDIFWKNLELPTPHFQLNIKGNGVVDIIGKTLLGLNEVIQKNHFDLVVVFGDVNATVAGAIAAAQSRLKIMHVEAGLRSFDRSMPEEINRIITDHVADYLMVSEPSGIQNLEKEGFEKGKYQLVGNIMIESLIRTRNKWEMIRLPDSWTAFAETRPIIATFHRPENVDNPLNLRRIVEIISTFSESNLLVFPVHPRTRANLIKHHFIEMLERNKNILLTEPMSYFEFLKFVSQADLVITDSGGVQEETSFMNVPCITFRRNTERPVTVELGTNLMMDIWDRAYFSKVKSHISKLNERSAGSIPNWDALVSERIISFIKKIFNN